MLTPQEVAKKSFTKARMGGYNMALVDEFLDQVTEDYTKLYEENSKLKAKLKVLVDKVEEYRATEEGMRSALYSAQKMAEDIVEEAKAKGADILTGAENDAREEIARIRAEVQREQDRLTLAQDEMSIFVAQWSEVCEKQAAFLQRLPQMRVPTGAEMGTHPSADEETVEQEEAAQPSDERPAAPEQPAEEQPADAPASAPAEQTDGGTARKELTVEQTIENILRETAALEASGGAAEATDAAPQKESDLFQTRTFRLDELHFGRNYDAK